MKKFESLTDDFHMRVSATTLSLLKQHGSITMSIDGEVYRLVQGVKEPIKLSADAILCEIIEETILKSHRQWRSIPETAYLVLVAIEDYQKAPKDAYEGKGKRAYYSARADMAAFNGDTIKEKAYRALAGQLPIEVTE